jgi:hypothetical protein
MEENAMDTNSFLYMEEMYIDILNKVFRNSEFRVDSTPEV